MLYCENCGALYEGEKCPLCRKRAGREPREDDLCLLTERGQIEADMLEDVLKQNGIPCLKKSVSGAGIAMYTGLMLESFRMYVNYPDYDQAREITEGFFAPVRQDGEEETEEEPTEEE